MPRYRLDEYDCEGPEDWAEPEPTCRRCGAFPVADDGDWCQPCIDASTLADLRQHCVHCGRQPVDESDLDEWADCRRRPVCGECRHEAVVPRGVRMAG